MKKIKFKDISLENNIQLSKDKGNSRFIKYFDILLTLLGVVGFVYVFISGFNIPVNNTIIMATSICSVLYFSFVLKKTKYIKYNLLGTSGILLLAVLLFYKNILDGFKLICQTITNMNLNFEFNNLNVNVFFIFSIILISGLISFSITYKPRFILLLILIVPLVLLVVFFEKGPYWVPCIMLIISLVSTLGMKYNLHYLNSYVASKGGVIVALIIVVTSIITAKVCSPSSYRQPYIIEKANNILQPFINNFNSEEFTNKLFGIAQGGVNGGKLGTINRIKYKNQTVLEVTTPWLGNNIYLRGYIGCEYTGNSWEELDDDSYYFLNSNIPVNGFNVNGDMITTLNYSSIDTDINYNTTISINNISANNDYAYVPYGQLYDNSYYSNYQLQNKKESYLYYTDKSSGYGFSYYPNLVNLSNVDSIKSEINKVRSTKLELTNIKEEEYAKFVNDEYTKLPDKGLDKIKAKYSGRYNQTKDLNGCINEAIAAVNDGTTYDLAPGKLPKGKDFVEYFLYENKKGYCTHYASAAAVILRAMGIPTRYVEGYVITKNDADNAKDTNKTVMYKQKINTLDEEEAIDKLKITKEDFERESINNFISSVGSQSVQVENKTMDIKDTNAHAWIEVYVENFGWIPIDVTPSIGIGNQDYEKVVNDKKVSTATTNQQTAQQNDVQQSVADNNLENRTDVNNSSDFKLLDGILIFVFCIVAIFAIIFIRYKIIIVKRRKSFSLGDNNKRVVFLYKYLTRIFNYLSIENTNKVIDFVNYIETRYPFINNNEFYDVINIVFKADFSNNSISEEELKKVEEFVIKFSDNMYSSLSVVQKIKYKYFRVLS